MCRVCSGPAAGMSDICHKCEEMAEEAAEAQDAEKAESGLDTDEIEIGPSHDVGGSD